MNPKIALLSTKSVWYSRNRYLLASFGIIIAIIAQIISSSMCESYRKNSQDELIHSGAAIISVNVMTEDRGEAINSLCCNTNKLSFAVPYYEDENLIWTAQEKQSVVYAFTNDLYFEMGTTNLLEGETELSDKHSMENTVIVNDLFACSTKPRLSVGSRLYINKIPFRIAGVVEDGRAEKKKMCYIHECYLPEMLDKARADSSWLFPIEGKDLERVGQVKNEIVEFFINRYYDRIVDLREQNSSNGEQIAKDFIYSVSYSENQYKQIAEKTEIIETVSLGFYVLLMSVGVLSIFNVFHMLYLDRTIEFGVSKSFGATTSDLLFQMLIETSFVGLCSILLGIAIGVGLTYLLGIVLQLKVIVVWKWIYISSIVVLVSTIIAGMIPSKRAASVDPSISINH